MIKGSCAYTVIENTIGVVPGNILEYRVYHQGILITKTQLIAVKADGHDRSGGYKMWLDLDERLMVPDARAVIDSYMRGERPTEEYSFELEVI